MRLTCSATMMQPYCNVLSFLDCDELSVTKNVVAGFLKLMLRHRCALHKIIVQCEICVYSEEIKRELKRILI